jgi:hypothetical protein
MGHSADIDLVQNQLREKEQLVAALTERLEQAAEQLDRLQRTGADKGRRPLVGGGLPAELVEEHKSTLEDLKRVIARWEDIQAEAALGRIETQIVELRDLVVSGGVSIGGAAPGHAVSHAAANPHAAAPAQRPAEGTEHRSGGKTGGNAWWEAQKAAMLGEPVPEATQAILAQEGAAAQAEEPAERASATAEAFDLARFNIPNLPAAVNFDEITLEQAHVAIRERDTLIEQLREPLLLWKTAGQLPAGFQSTTEIPEPLKQCIADLEAQWQAKFRQVELNLSLERARLAREQAAVRQQQELLQKQSKNGGVSKSDSDHDDKDEDGSSKRRWFRFMGSAAEGNQAAGADQKK